MKYTDFVFKDGKVKFEVESKLPDCEDSYYIQKSVGWGSLECAIWAMDKWCYKHNLESLKTSIHI